MSAGPAYAALGPPARGSPWEGWFFIFVGRRGGAVRWAKAHLFVQAPRPGWHPLSAVEGLSSDGEVVGLAAVEGRLLAARAAVARSDVSAAPGGLSVAAPGRFRLAEEPPRVRCSFRAPEAPLGAELELSGCEPIEWARLPGVLRYAGALGSARGTVRQGAGAWTASGLGMAEHAHGGQLPFDPARWLPERWHWDVLSFERDESQGVELTPPNALATLAMRLPRLGFKVVRARGRALGEGGPGLGELEVLEVAKGEGASFPRRWRARVRAGDGELSYEAQATPPFAPMTPGGGFLGFELEARVRRPGYSDRRLAGSGFCECGGRAPARVG